MKINMEKLYELKDDLDSVLALPGGVVPTNEWGINPDKYNIKLSPNFIESFIIYPQRRLFPPKLLPPLPFTYPLMGKNQNETKPEDILNLYSEFVDFLRNDLKKPGVPDEYWVLAKYFKKDCGIFTQELINYLIQRDYANIKGIITKMNH